MHRPRLLVTLACLAFVGAPTAGAEPLGVVVEPGPTCETPPAGLLPHVPLQVRIDRDAHAQYQAQGWVMLNNRGYGYRVADAPSLQQPAAPAKPAPDPR